MQPREDKRKPFTVGLVRVRMTPEKAALVLCDGCGLHTRTAHSE